MTKNRNIFNGLLILAVIILTSCANSGSNESSIQNESPTQNKTSIQNESPTQNKTSIQNELPTQDESLKLDEVTIGNQVWTSKNLDVSTFRNGDPIPEAKTCADWEKACAYLQPAFCYFDNTPANGTKYGKLYNFYAVNDPRGLAPQGWHIPTDAEWTELTDYLGGVEKAGAKLKSKEGWSNDGNGTNSSLFSGLPGGFIDSRGLSYAIGEGGYWWSSTEYSTNVAHYRFLFYNNGFVGWDNHPEYFGLSVRCIRD
jgi:uncharacterized protein (TIGR02145 family)